MTGAGRRYDAVHNGLRITRSRLRRGERYRARRIVRLFSTFITASIREAGIGILSSFLDALAVPADVRDTLLQISLTDFRYGRDDVYNSLNWLLLIILSDVNACVRTHISIHADDAPGIVYLSDSD